MKRLIDRAVAPVLALPRFAKRLIAMALDAGLCVLTVWFAFYLRVGEWVTLSSDGRPAVVASLVLALPIFVAFGLYRAVFRHVSWEALLAVVQAVFVYGLVYASIFTAWRVDGVPRTIGLIQPMLLLIGVGASRAVGRYLLGGMYRHWLNRKRRSRVLIYGAGSAGRQLAAALSNTPHMRVVGYIDDNRGLQGSVIGGVRIWPPEHVERLVHRLEVAEIFLAIPSASRARRNEVLRVLQAAGVAVRTLPGLLDLAAGTVTVTDLRPLEVEDLLGRESVAPDGALLERNIRDQVVLVTGAGGSIGSELCRQIVALGPRRLLLVDSSEFALYAVHRELNRFGPMPGDSRAEIVPLLASVTDEGRMRRIFSTWRPSTVYHAAAYKHVPLVEQNIVDGVRNNVLGTLVSARIAEECNTERFVLISTDKAVRPTNVMGTSKRLAEMVLQALAAKPSRTCFTMVRFGNVLGSSGSVVPLFRQQIAAGGPLTVTHPDVVRYFMTIPEAAQLVLQAGAMAKGGEVFVLDMGSPVKVLDLAVKMIELSGLSVRNDDNPDGDVEIVFTGLRPGEKLYEELLIGENPVATSHPRVKMANERLLPLEALTVGLEQLRCGLEHQDAVLVRSLLSKLVPEYVPAADIVDWTCSLKTLQLELQEETRVVSRSPGSADSVIIWPKHG